MIGATRRTPRRDFNLPLLLQPLASSRPDDMGTLLQTVGGEGGRWSFKFRCLGVSAPVSTEWLKSRCPVSTALCVVGCENEASTAEDSGKATL